MSMIAEARPIPDHNLVAIHVHHYPLYVSLQMTPEEAREFANDIVEACYEVEMRGIGVDANVRE